MATKINLTYCGMDGAGRTVTEAKQDAARKLERACESSGREFGIILTVVGDVIVVHDGLRLGEYSFASATRSGVWGCFGNGDAKETAFRACVHAIQSFGGIAWTCGISARIVNAAREEAHKRAERDALSAPVQVAAVA